MKSEILDISKRNWYKKKPNYFSYKCALTFKMHVWDYQERERVSQRNCTKQVGVYSLASGYH